jgi:hypothetical protein
MFDSNGKAVRAGQGDYAQATRRANSEPRSRERNATQRRLLAFARDRGIPVEWETSTQGVQELRLKPQSIAVARELRDRFFGPQSQLLVLLSRSEGYDRRGALHPLASNLHLLEYFRGAKLDFLRIWKEKGSPSRERWIRLGQWNPKYANAELESAVIQLMPHEVGTLSSAYRDCLDAQQPVPWGRPAALKVRLTQPGGHLTATQIRSDPQRADCTRAVRNLALHEGKGGRLIDLIMGGDGSAFGRQRGGGKMIGQILDHGSPVVVGSILWPAGTFAEPNPRHPWLFGSEQPASLVGQRRFREFWV